MLIYLSIGIKARLSMARKGLPYEGAGQKGHVKWCRVQSAWTSALTGGAMIGNFGIMGYPSPTSSGMGMGYSMEYLSDLALPP